MTCCCTGKFSWNESSVRSVLLHLNWVFETFLWKINAHDAYLRLFTLQTTYIVWCMNFDVNLDRTLTFIYLLWLLFCMSLPVFLVSSIQIFERFYNTDLGSFWEFWFLFADSLNALYCTSRIVFQKVWIDVSWTSVWDLNWESNYF
jgi:hypothetical protein